MLPTPPDGLRHWEPADAPALAAAWADPTITAWSEPPTDLDPGAWIAGVEARWERGLALDLVVDVDGAVAGEVGLSGFTTDPARAELGVWVAPPHRGRGLAHGAVDVVARWALTPVPEGLGLEQVWARVDVRNRAGLRLFAGAGWQRLGTRDGIAIWATTSAVLR